MTITKQELEEIMKKSSVDKRRVLAMYEIGASDDENRYHTAYSWADAVVGLITTLQNQVKALEEIFGQLYGLEKQQNSLRIAIRSLIEEIRFEEKIEAEFWSYKPENFDRNF